MFLIATKFGKGQVGSFSWEINPTKEIHQFCKYLDEKYANKGVQIVLISSTTGYGEYAPYYSVPDKDSFESVVNALSVA